jgi:two-component system phosphate regulon response regulator PhoB
MIAFHLSRAGFETVEAGDARTAREQLADTRPDLALIDWMLPDTSGLELTRMLKRDKNYEDLAIIMLTARAEERDKVSGLEGGADDYVTKPFSPRELIARIQAVLRRANSVGDEVVTAGVLELDTAGHRVVSSGKEIKLGPTEYRLLQFLMTHPIVCTVVPSCSIASGVPMSTSKSERSTCTCAGCARRCPRRARTTTSRP